MKKLKKQVIKEKMTSKGGKDLEKNNENQRRFRGELRQKLAEIGIVFLFVLGACILFYPYVSNLIAQYNCIKVIESYSKYTTQLSKEVLDEEWEKAQIYNKSLISGTDLLVNYDEVLNIRRDGVIGYLEIPVIQVELPIAHGVSDEVLQQYAGHIQQTALPIGEIGSHSVISAHTGSSSAKLFNDLVKLKENDVFVISVLNKQFIYRVDEIEVILPEEVEKIQRVPGEDRVTLLTCTPYGVNSHRLLVKGVRILNNEVDIVKETDKSEESWPLKLMCLFFLILLAVIVIVRRNYLKKWIVKR